MKDEILKLREEGYSYRKISNKLGCSKATVSYHCGDGQKEKNKKRAQQRRKKTVICKRVESFQYKKYDRRIKDKTEDFQRTRYKKKGCSRLGKRKLTFTWRDVIAKFSWHTHCYLTGEPINLREPKSYEFDHKIPYSKGGSCEIDNLGIATKKSNQAKKDMTLEEFVELCKSVLEHQGYKVSK